MLRKYTVAVFAAIALATVCLTFIALGTAGDPRLVDTAMQNDLEGVRALIKQAVDVNSPQGDGMTALHWAAMKNDADLTDTLLHAGADVRATTRTGGARR